MKRPIRLIAMSLTCLLVCQSVGVAGRSGRSSSMLKKFQQAQQQQWQAQQKAAQEAAARQAAVEQHKKEMHAKASKARHEKEAQNRQEIVDRLKAKQNSTSSNTK